MKRHINKFQKRLDIYIAFVSLRNNDENKKEINDEKKTHNEIK